MFQLDVRTGPRELRAAVLALKSADKELKRDINAAVVSKLSSAWASALSANTGAHPLDQTLLTGARVKGGNPPVVVAGGSAKKLKGGFKPSVQAYAVEFGANREKVTTYTRKNRKNTGNHQVTRHTSRQMPPRYRAGRIVYKTFADFAPRAVSLWVQLIVKKYMEAAEQGGK